MRVDPLPLVTWPQPTTHSLARGQRSQDSIRTDRSADGRCSVAQRRVWRGRVAAAACVRVERDGGFLLRIPSHTHHHTHPFIETTTHSATRHTLRHTLWPHSARTSQRTHGALGRHATAASRTSPLRRQRQTPAALTLPPHCARSTSTHARTHTSGCGAHFQHSDPSRPGYLPPSVNPALAAHRTPPRPSVHARYDAALASAAPRHSPTSTPAPPSHDAERSALLGIRPDAVSPTELARLLRTPAYAHRLSAPPRALICQRCHRLSHHRVEYARAFPSDLARAFAPFRTDSHHVVVALLDILDIPASIPTLLPSLLGPASPHSRRVIVAANKADALPLGFSPDRLRRLVREQWRDVVGPSLGSPAVLWDVVLVSARTGQGVPDLLAAVNAARRPRDDVVLVGAANAGKSQLVNTLFRMVGASRPDHEERTDTLDGHEEEAGNDLTADTVTDTPPYMDAWHPHLPRHTTPPPKRLARLPAAALVTTSPLPGTTVSLIRFPISTGVLARLFPPPKVPAHTFGRAPPPPPPHQRTTPHLIDTPGLPTPTTLLSHLTLPECALVVPSAPIKPRSLRLTPGRSIFLGGVGRVDHVSGPPVDVAVLAGKHVTVHPTRTWKARGLWERHVGGLLRPPVGEGEAVGGAGEAAGGKEATGGKEAA
ncbi:hypothetical protein M427DRAFT_33773, partial [Gonapodya prolifera JEL478]